ncbi:tetratricopeptide repeat protein [Pseudodesulfovibrio alkaliphilus]|uniref:tetratricopeptide repeat protein n=1 Tax=Pseudodesulfovibrio alkaliphilus TaxID=2661613 RepID=UPI003462A2F5
MRGDCEIMGVYSHSTKYEYKIGQRGSRYRHGTYWFVRRRGEDMYEVRPLNANHIPSGVSRLIDRDEFLTYYTPELTYYQENTLPCLEALRKKVRMGRRYFNLGQMDRAEREFCSAVLMQEDSVDANMALSEVYAEQQEFTKLRTVLDKLLNIDEVFREEQRHRFNEFGINLRKQGRFDDAIRFYAKALEVNEDDENLHFNMARALHGKGRDEACREHLARCMELNPEMAEARSFLRSLDAVRAEESNGERAAGRGDGGKENYVFSLK